MQEGYYALDTVNFILFDQKHVLYSSNYTGEGQDAQRGKSASSSARRPFERKITGCTSFCSILT